MMYRYFKRRDLCVEASQFGHAHIFAVSLLMDVNFLELDRSAHASCMRACVRQQISRFEKRFSVRSGVIGQMIIPSSLVGLIILGGKNRNFFPVVANF